MKRCLTVLLVLISSNFSTATIIPLSDAATNAGISATDLKGQIDFAVTGNTLNLTVTNLTSGTQEFWINEIVFNCSDKVTGLANAGQAGMKWDVTFARDAINSVAGFGSFDISVYNNGKQPGRVMQGQSQKNFQFTILGTGPFTADDFTAQSTDLKAHAAAYFFKDGSNTQETYGVALPEPATLVILGLGWALISMRR